MYQFIVISISDERRQKIIEQFNDYNMTPPIFLENPSTIHNSESYFPENTTLYNKKVMCCSRDHLRALELASNNESPEFTIILEDDVAFHKTKFLDGIKEIINNWDNIPHDMVSLGWVPCNKYENYMNSKPFYKCNTISDVTILNDRYVVGTQAYIVKKDDMKKYSKIFGHTSFDNLEKALRSFNNKYIEDCIPIDEYLNKVLNSCYTFPPLAIEQDILSTLRDYNHQRRYWINFYNGVEHYMKDYWSF